MPALQPTEIWQQSGRAETARDVLFKVKDSAQSRMGSQPDRRGGHHHASPPSEINSYRQLPKNFYQISVKFRDEIRPRFGLMRAQEFIMKDAYSFDVSGRGARRPAIKKCTTPTRAFLSVRTEGISGRGRHRRHRRQIFARIHGAGGDGRE